MKKLNENKNISRKKAHVYTHVHECELNFYTDCKYILSIIK